jgi:hypothetical protein
MQDKALLNLWKLEDIPAWGKAWSSPKRFLMSSGEGIDKLGTEEPEQRICSLTEA